MGRIIKGVLAALLLCIPVRAGDSVMLKADVVYYVKIPDEIKLESREDAEIGDFEDYTEPVKPHLTHEDEICLQKIAVAEAGNAGAEAMAYVMQTVVNRVYSEEFPDTVFGVVSQEGQFSTYPGKYGKAVPDDGSSDALSLMYSLDNMKQLYFENTVPGSWQSENLEFVMKKGSMSFYR